MTINEASLLSLNNISNKIKSRFQDFYNKYLRHINQFVGTLEIEKLAKGEVYQITDKKKNNPTIESLPLINILQLLR